jgi:hypothetical protein
MSMPFNADHALSFPLSLSELDAFLIDATDRVVHLGSLVLHAIQSRSKLFLLITQCCQFPPFDV